MQVPYNFINSYH